MRFQDGCKSLVEKLTSHVGISRQSHILRCMLDVEWMWRLGCIYGPDHPHLIIRITIKPLQNLTISGTFIHQRHSHGPPSPAKTTASSPPSSPSAAHYESTSKKRREEPPLTSPIIDSDLPPTIKSLEPRKGPICRENHVIIIGINFAAGMMPMFGREHGNVIEINPFYIECTTPIYPHVETVPVWIYHNEVGTYSDKTYDFTNELAQSDLELLLRHVLPAGAEGMDAATYMSMMGRLSNAPSSTDISGQSGSNGSTMLHNSVMLKYQSGVDILIEEGIELDVEDDAGLTALDYAIFVNNVEITEALLRAGSVPSYERLATLPLATTSEMSALLKDLCDMDLPVSEDSAVAQESESGAAHLTSAVEASPEDEQVQDDAIDESLELADTVSETLGLNDGQPSQGSENTRVSQQRNPRPLSIATVSTVSTGMVSLAPTVSTMATSVASSTHQRARPSRPSNQTGKGGVENIYHSAKKGNLSLVKYHLQKDPTLINAPWSFDGRSALSSACAARQPYELVEYLVQRGAQVNQADTFYKRTALHTLCEEGGLSQEDWSIVISQADRDADDQDVLAAMRFLLDHGAEVDAKNHWKETPLMRLFAGRDCPLMVQELYSRGADSRLKSSKVAYPHGTALCYAAFHGRVKSLKWIIENDLLLNDEGNIKEATRWAKLTKGNNAEAIQLLESWAGELGAIKRKDLAKEVTAQSSEDWWRRMSGIVVEDLSSSSSSSKHVSADAGGEMDVGEPAAATSRSTKRDSGSTKMPAGMMPLWREVHALSEGLSNSDAVSSPGSKMKWNPLTMLRK